jgi:LPXTG-site transpeptidase (sortase) family protein
MNRKRKLFVAVAVTVCAAAVFGITLVHSVFYAPDAEVSSVTASAEGISVHAPTRLAQYGSQNGSQSKTAVHPVRLLIPALDIDANMQLAGITLEGNMGIPSNFTDVAWYKYGPLPGEVGSAVIDGHVDNGLALPGVFKFLGNIQRGDAITVRMSNGKTVDFKVSAVDSYDYKNVSINTIFANTSKPILRLITCTGAWVQADRTYGQRLVVTAELVSS